MPGRANPHPLIPSSLTGRAPLLAQAGPHVQRRAAQAVHEGSDLRRVLGSGLPLPHTSPPRRPNRKFSSGGLLRLSCLDATDEAAVCLYVPFCSRQSAGSTLPRGRREEVFPSGEAGPLVADWPLRVGP